MAEIEIFKGRPAEMRTAREMAAYDFLDALGVSYARADHPAVGENQNQFLSRRGEIFKGYFKSHSVIVSRNLSATICNISENIWI